MSKIDEQRQTLTNKILTQFTPSYPDVPVWYPNQNFKEPEGSEWVKMSILGGESTQSNLGLTNITERHIGILQFDVVVPEDSGTKTANEIAEKLKTIFSRKDFIAGVGNCLRFQTAAITPRGVMHGSYRIVVRLPFRREERH